MSKIEFEVPIYTDLLDPNRKNVKVPGFDFDVDKFENLISYFTPIENIPIILGCKHADLDRFCNKVYNMNFKEAYTTLSTITDYWCRRVVSNLAASGNTTALKTMTEHFMGLTENKNVGVNITVVNDLKEDE